jgi:hypothetical protein
MSVQTCLIHGMPMHYDFRSGFEICDMCEAIEANGEMSASPSQSENDIAHTSNPTPRNTPWAEC